MERSIFILEYFYTFQYPILLWGIGTLGDGDSFEIGCTTDLPPPVVCPRELTGGCPEPRPNLPTPRGPGLPQLPVLMNSFTGTQLYPCVYILFCSCFGIRTGWEDWDRCHGTDTWYLPPVLSQGKLPACLHPPNPHPVHSSTTQLQHGHMGKPCQLRRQE